MKPALLLLSAVCWFAVPQGRCSEQTLSSQDKQLVTDSNEVDSQSSSSSGILELVPVSAAPHESRSAECVSCRDCVVSDSCPADSLSSAACDHQLTLPSFPEGQENASVRETRKPAKDRSRKRSNASLVLRDQASSDSDPSVSGRDQEIPTFDEWTKIMMETEKSQVTPQAPDGQKLQQTVTNYASVECGAKILSSNPEAKSTSAVLMENMDMYMLNPCNNKIWFIIELCQPIQVKQLDIANFEIFSSNPRDFLVSISDRYPNKKWVKLGTFHARDERTVQSFPLDEHLFAKFVKVELLSHFGSEHFCPLSLIRVFGTSMMEEYELNSEASDRHTHTPDEQDYGQTPDFVPVDDKSSANLIGSAKDALLTMVNNIAANVLGGQGAGNSSSAALNASEGALPAGVEHSGPEADQPDDPETASRSHTDAPHTEDAPGRAEPEPEQIVTLLPEDEPDQTPGAGLGQSERTADTERSHDLSLLEYLLQRCPSPQKRKSSRSMSSVTESPVSPSELQPVEWALAPSLTSDLLLPADPEPPISEGLTATLPPLSPESADRPDPDPLVDLVPSSGDPEIGSGPEDASAPAAEDPLIMLTPEGPLEPAEARGKELLEDELEGDSEGPAQGSGQKESVFMRLNNRIKALEMNMSLSGRYLEQLSQRYRKQVEEMQRAFNKTVIKLQNTSQTAEEQDQRQTDSIQGLQAQLENVTQLVLRLSVSVSRLQHEVSDRQSYILLCLILCVLLALLICVNYRQMCESPALDTLEREPLSDEGPLILGRRASEPPSLSSLQTPEGGSEETSSLKQCPVSRKKKHKLKLSRSLEARAAPPAPGVIPQITIGPQGSEVREAVSDGSEGSSHSEETLFCGFSSCTRLCETKPAPRRWTQSGRQKTPEQLHQPPQRSQPYDLTSGHTGHTDRWTH